MNKNEALKVQGFTALRKPQETTLDCLLAGQDAVCIMGTGSGKSAIFTTFALMQEQLVVVIEPHLALELDQVRLLRERDIAAAAINSMTGAKERRAVLKQAAEGTLRLLYLTPEMAQNKAVKTALRKTQVAAVAVDEAHCVVKQGPGFREEYLTLPEAGLVAEAPSGDRGVYGDCNAVYRGADHFSSRDERSAGASSERCER